MISASSNLSNCKISWKKDYSQIWHKKRIILVFLGTNLKKKCLIWSQSRPICLIAKFLKKWKSWNLRPKMHYLFSFGEGVLKILPYLKLAPSTSSKRKIWRKNNMEKFETKKGFIWVFLDWNLKTILSYLKSAPSNLSKCKIHETMQRPKFESKNTWFGYFWVRIWKNYRDIQNQHRRICLIAKFCEKTNKTKNG